MLKTDPGRLREPAAWLMLALVWAGVLIAVMRLLFTGTSFGDWSAYALDALTSPVHTALALGAFVLATRFGPPVPRARTIHLVVIGALGVSALLGVIGLLGTFFAGAGAMNLLAWTLTGVLSLLLTVVALVYAMSVLPPAAPRRNPVPGGGFASGMGPGHGPPPFPGQDGPAQSMAGRQGPGHQGGPAQHGTGHQHGPGQPGFGQQAPEQAGFGREGTGQLPALPSGGPQTTGPQQGYGEHPGVPQQFPGPRFAGDPPPYVPADQQPYVPVEPQPYVPADQQPYVPVEPQPYVPADQQPYVSADPQPFPQPEQPFTAQQPPRQDHPAAHHPHGEPAESPAPYPPQPYAAGGGWPDAFTTGARQALPQPGPGEPGHTGPQTPPQDTPYGQTGPQVTPLDPAYGQPAQQSADPGYGQTGPQVTPLDPSYGQTGPQVSPAGYGQTGPQPSPLDPGYGQTGPQVSPLDQPGYASHPTGEQARPAEASPLYGDAADARMQQIAQAYQQAQHYQNQGQSQAGRPEQNAGEATGTQPVRAPGYGYGGPFGHPQTPPDPQGRQAGAGAAYGTGYGAEQQPYPPGDRSWEETTTERTMRYEQKAFQDDPLNAPLPSSPPSTPQQRRGDALDPTAIYAPDRAPQARPEESDGRDQAQSADDQGAPWYGSDR
ncbi:hypothetical protein GCM10009677_13770 [Sphaerisporangium rubeum]|uniref:Uncharacterized protein n=1 Tax=Sphaerisporangium rubeum TaxID=321317 RepID=A0A7X0IBD9_9ACTN|nr:hypothetical protein [Sphaerisporangium rubeum]MBB6472051.1 hypothetical protein [Sphaerisporangium rubeum]